MKNKWKHDGCDHHRIRAWSAPDGLKPLFRTLLRGCGMAAPANVVAPSLSCRRGQRAQPRWSLGCSIDQVPADRASLSIHHCRDSPILPKAGGTYAAVARNCPPGLPLASVGRSQYRIPRPSQEVAVCGRNCKDQRLLLPSRTDSSCTHAHSCSFIAAAPRQPGQRRAARVQRWPAAARRGCRQGP